jgi:hypothetical protein
MFTRQLTFNLKSSVASRNRGVATSFHMASAAVDEALNPSSIKSARKPREEGTVSWGPVSSLSVIADDDNVQIASVFASLSGEGEKVLPERFQALKRWVVRRAVLRIGACRADCLVV